MGVFNDKSKLKVEEQGAKVLRVTTSGDLALFQDGQVLEVDNDVTLTIRSGLPENFSCAVIPKGTIGIAFAGTTGNGSAGTMTRKEADNKMFAIQQLASVRTAYIITGT